MAQALENRGTVVANDIFWDRIRPLRAAVDRLGLLNVSVTCHDGTSFPQTAGRFDRVLPLFHMHFRFPKLTTSCAATFGRLAGRNVIDATPGQLMEYLGRKPFTLENNQANACCSTGYVLVRYNNAVVGVGFYEEGQDTVTSLFPKSMAAL
jgi:hypothetical protein